MTFQKTKLGKMKRAWLIQWEFHVHDEVKALQNIGIQNKIIDLVNVRKTFEQIISMTKDIYCRSQLSLSERVFLEHYSEGRRRKEEFFKRVPVSTNHNTIAYRDYMISFRENGINHPATEKLFLEWRKFPTYVIVGYDPSIEARLVSNLVIYKISDGKEMVEWDEQLTDGTYCKKSYEI